MATVLDELIVRIGPKFVGRGELRGLERGIQRAEQRLDDLSGKFAAAGAALTALAGGTLAAFSSQEAKWAEVSAKTGVSVEKLRAQYETAARSISEETGIATTKILDGFQKAISAGFEGEEAIKLVGAAAKAEASGIGALEDQVSAATTVMTAFGESGDEALDKIARAAQVGEGETEDFARSLKGVTQLAEPMGIKFSELAATLANVSQTAKSVPEAETQLNAFLKALADPSDQARKALEDFTDGLITFEDLQANLKTEGLASVVGTLQTIANEDPSKIAALFPEVEAQKFFNTVDPRIVEELFKQIEAGEGTIDRAFGEGAETVKRRWDQTRETFKNIAADIGETLAPAFAKLAENLRAFADWFKELDPRVKEFLGYFVGAGPGLLIVAGALKAISTGLSGLAGLSSLFAATGPIGLIIAGLAALAGLGYLLAANFGKGGLFDITEPFAFEVEAWNALTDWAKDTWETMRGWWAGFSTWWANLRLSPSTVLNFLATGLTDVANTMLQDWWPEMKGAWATVTGWWGRQNWSMDWLETAFAPATIAANVRGFGASFRGAWASVITWWDGATKRIGATLEWAWADTLNWWNTTPLVPDNIRAWVDGAVAEVAAGWNAMVAIVTAAPTNVWGWLTDAVEAPFAWVDQAWSNMLDRLVGPIDDLWGWLVRQVEAPFKWVDDAWGYMLSRLVPPLDDMWAFLRTPIEGIFDWVIAAWDLVMAEIRAAWDDFYGAVTEPLRFLGILERPEDAQGQASSSHLLQVPDDFTLPGTPTRDRSWYDPFLDLFANAGQLAPPLPLGPVPVAAGAAAGGLTLNGGISIVVQAPPGADAQDIASRVSTAFEEEMRALAEELDGNALA